MNKRTLLPAVTFAVLAGVTLSSSVLADPLSRDGASIVVRGQLPLPVVVVPPLPRIVVGLNTPQHYDMRRVEPPRHHHHHDRHVAARHFDGPRYAYPPRIERREVRNDYAPLQRHEPSKVEAPRYEYRAYEEPREQRSNYRPVENYRPVTDDNLRIRISYDIHL